MVSGQLCAGARRAAWQESCTPENRSIAHVSLFALASAPGGAVPNSTGERRMFGTLRSIKIQIQELVTRAYSPGRLAAGLRLEVGSGKWGDCPRKAKTDIRYSYWSALGHLRLLVPFGPLRTVRSSALEAVLEATAELQQLDFQCEPQAAAAEALTKLCQAVALIVQFQVGLSRYEKAMRAKLKSVNESDTTVRQSTHA